MSSITDRLGAIVRNPTTVTVTTAAIAAFVAAALAAGGVQPLLVQFGILRGRGGNGSQRKASREERLLRHVFQRAAEGNPSSVLAVMDDFGWKTEFHMSVGDTKGVFLRNEVANRNPKVAVEIGGYCGYSATLIASQLPADGHLYSIEFDPLHAAIATKVLEFAGLSSKVTVLVGTVETRLPTLQTKYGVKEVDLLFIDHVKGLYLSDLNRVEAAGLLVKGAVVIADNVIVPGAPDLLAYFKSEEGRLYHTVLHDTTLEYKSDVKDGVTVSTRLQ